MKLHTLKAPDGACKKRKRVGRGPGSGHGGTSCKGHKGQKARGKGKGHYFEGGQTPITRRIPKIKGFENINRKSYAIVNVGDLNFFEDNSQITPELLIKNNFIKDVKDGVKILGDGDITKKLKVVAHKFSKKAKEKIESAGGEAIVCS